MTKRPNPDTYVGFYLSKKTHRAKLRRLAKKSGLSFSAFMRDLCERYIRGERFIDCNASVSEGGDARKEGEP